MGLLKQGSRSIAGRGRVRVRQGLIVSQTAFALMLVLAAGLMIRSFWNLTRVNVGFDPENVVTFEVALPATNYPTRERAVALHAALLERVRALPGVDRAGASTCLPLCGSWAGNPWAREDRPAAPGEIPPIVATRRVSEDYLEAMRVAVLQGRGIEHRDREQRTGAAVVNRRAAARLFPGEEPIGKTIYHATNPEDPAWYRVVGVVENAPVTSLTDDPTPIVYLPLLHRDADGPNPRRLAYAVRSTIPPLGLVDAIRGAVAELDPAVPVANVRTMPAVVRAAGASMAFAMVLLVLAATMALFLGVVGVYSVVAYMVSLRTAEFGVRLAMGARAEELSRMVMRQGGALVGVGVVLGSCGALALTRFMRAMIFGVSPHDPATFVAVPVVLGVVAVMAILGPARRAASVDPIQSLRAE
jgi:predicted permease